MSGAAEDEAGAGGAPPSLTMWGFTWALIAFVAALAYVSVASGKSDYGAESEIPYAIGSLFLYSVLPIAAIVFFRWRRLIAFSNFASDFDTLLYKLRTARGSAEAADSIRELMGLYGAARGAQWLFGVLLHGGLILVLIVSALILREGMAVERLTANEAGLLIIFSVFATLSAYFLLWLGFESRPEDFEPAEAIATALK